MAQVHDSAVVNTELKNWLSVNRLSLNIKKQNLWYFITKIKKLTKYHSTLKLTKRKLTEFYFYFTWGYF